MQLLIFKYEDGNSLNELATVEISGEIWFVAADVCKLLDISNVSDAIGTLEDDERTTSVIPRGSRMVKANLVNESGLYTLIFKSKKAGAKKFRKWVTKEVLPSLRTKGFYGKIDRNALPNFITRYKENYHKLDRNYFSVISEMFARLYMELEKVGYVIPDKSEDGKQMMPDISVGITFSKYLQNVNSEYYNKHKKYSHSFPDGREVDANQYPIEALPDFIKFVHSHWIPNCAEKYFKERDMKALDYLPKLIGPIPN